MNKIEEIQKYNLSDQNFEEFDRKQRNDKIIVLVSQISAIFQTVNNIKTSKKVERMVKQIHTTPAIKDRLNTFNHIEKIKESFSKKIRNELAGTPKKESLIKYELRHRLRDLNCIEHMNNGIKNKLKITDVL